jgi:hypothetical protein
VGYTHYFNTEKCRTQKARKDFVKALPTVRDIINRYRDRLCFECDEVEKEPEVTETTIRFNGRGDEGHETFLISLDDNDSSAFCKTARKPYDIAVCEVLLVLKAFLPKFNLSSDGFSGHLAQQEQGVKFDGTWDQAIQNVENLYGIRFHGEIVNRREPYCDMEPIFDGKDHLVKVAVPA